MNSRLLIALFSFALGLNTALLVVSVFKIERVEDRLDRMAQPPEEPHGGPMLMGLPRVNPEQLGLNEVQQRQVRELRQQWRKEEAERRKESMAIRRQIPELFEQEDVSIDRLLPLLDQAHEDSKQRLQALMRLYRAYQEILTPEQQAQFKQLIREQQRRHHGQQGPRERMSRLRDRKESSGDERRERRQRMQQRRQPPRDRQDGEDDSSEYQRPFMDGNGGPGEGGPPPGPPPEGLHPEGMPPEGRPPMPPHHDGMPPEMHGDGMPDHPPHDGPPPDGMAPGGPGMPGSPPDESLL